MSDTTTSPRIMLATAEFKDGDVVMSLHDKDKTKVDFILDPMAVAILAITLQPAMRSALAEERAKNPGKFSSEGGIPDTPEGL